MSLRLVWASTITAFGLTYWPASATRTAASAGYYPVVAVSAPPLPCQTGFDSADGQALQPATPGDAQKAVESA